jgi:hypothetical protein
MMARTRETRHHGRHKAFTNNPALEGTMCATTHSCRWLLSIAIFSVPLLIRAETPQAPPPVKAPEIIEPDQANLILNPNNGTPPRTSETNPPANESPQTAGIFHPRPAVYPPNCPPGMLPWQPMPSDPKKTDDTKKDPKDPKDPKQQAPEQPDDRAPTGQTESGAFTRASNAPYMFGDQFGTRSSSASVTFGSITGQAYLTNNGNTSTFVSILNPNQPLTIPITNSNISALMGGAAIAKSPAINTTVTTINPAGTILAPVGAANLAGPAAPSVSGTVPLQNNSVVQQYASSVFSNKFGPNGQTVFQNANLSGSATSGYSSTVVRLPNGATTVSTTRNSLTFAPSSQVNFNYTYVGTLSVPLPSAGGVVGTTKVSENNSPMPRDRVIFDYDNFSNVPLTPSGFNVERFSPGFEKTFFDGRTSVEMRLPFASTMDSTSTAAGAATRAIELGNLHMTLKGLFYTSEALNMSTGLGIAMPTAADTVVQLTDGTDLVRIRNQSLILTPYLAVLYTPTERLFTQAWAQIDFDATGSSVLANPNLTGLVGAGRIYDQKLLQLDWQIGYQLFQNSGAYSYVTSLSPFLELHYNSPLNNANTVQIESLTVNSSSNRYNELNIATGINTVFRNRVNVMAGVVLPLEGGNGKFFDVQFGIRANWMFGPGADRTTVPNNF